MCFVCRVVVFIYHNVCKGLDLCIYESSTVYSTVMNYNYVQQSLHTIQTLNIRIRSKISLNYQARDKEKSTLSQILRLVHDQNDTHRLNYIFRLNYTLRLNFKLHTDCLPSVITNQNALFSSKTQIWPIPPPIETSVCLQCVVVSVNFCSENQM